MKAIALILSLSFTIHANAIDVMTYNVWYGFNKKKSISLAQEWLLKQDIDVLALQELKGFDVSSLSEIAKIWGHKYALLNPRSTGFPQGLTSNKPIEFMGMLKPSGKGYRETLHCKTHGIHFFVVHLNPHNYLKRQVEAKVVANKVSELINLGEKAIVLGDFNAHSEVDSEILNKQNFLIEKWQKKEKEKKGFRQFDSQGKIDFSVMNALFESGLKDYSKSGAGTFPTKILAPDESTSEYLKKMQRIDFILTCPSLDEFSPEVSYPKDDILHKISDHFPVKLSLKKR